MQALADALVADLVARDCSGGLARPYLPVCPVLGRADGLRGFHHVERYPQARRVPGLLLFRWDAPLFIANAELFQQCVLQAVAAAPAPLRRALVTAEPVISVDVTAADMLREPHATLEQTGIELPFAEMKDSVKERLVGFELMEQLVEGNFCPTIGAAVDAYVKDHSVDWEP